MFKGLHVRRRPIFLPKSSEDQKKKKKGPTRFMSFRSSLAFRPQGGDIAHFENHCFRPSILGSSFCITINF